MGEGWSDYTDYPSTLPSNKVFCRRQGFANSLLLVHCSMLAEDAIKSAISNYYTKNPSAKPTNLAGTGASMPKIEVETVMVGGA